MLPPMRFALSIAAAIAALASGTAAQPRLSLPVDCRPGETCWIVNHVDHDPGKGASDYHCGALGYDGHKGTDFAIRDEAAMASGVGVLAAAAGTVKAVRDAMPDTGLRDAAPDAVAGRECGNGVVVEHGDGWETQYCHMRRGSVAVRAGEPVARGARLGLVGLSGSTEFPHLHLSVRHAGKVVDPFLGAEPFGACRASADALWDEPARAALAYQPSAIYNAGFSGGPPDADRIRRGAHDPEAARKAAALVLWADIFGVDAGDRLSLRILGPDGSVVVENARTLDRRQIRRFEFAGKRTPAGAWPEGRYSGEIALTRHSGGRDLTVRREIAVDLR
jgi:murein DD-endopeptidase MepM/ murein hydrolase activator NlpD